MPVVTLSDVYYGLSHPLRAWYYLLHRDVISYETCASYLPSEPIIVEAGAYDGTNTCDFCRFWPGCQVYAFEPVPSAYDRLLGVTSVFPAQIHPQNMALGRRTAVSQMHVSTTGVSGGGEQSSSLLAPAATREEFPFVGFREDTIPVQVTRLDEWAAENHVNHVDFLWLDLQGMELAALEGCGELLSKISVIHCEVQNFPLYEGAPSYRELSRWLEKRRFYVAHEAIFRRGGNVLFVRRR